MPLAVEADVVFVRQSDPETRLPGVWNNLTYAAAQPIAKRRTPSSRGLPFISMVKICFLTFSTSGSCSKQTFASFSVRSAIVTSLF